MQMGSQIASYNYRVFLSFRGPDTREIFIEPFNELLRDSGILAFLDSDEIEYGDRIDMKIMGSIERSDICIPVFSEDFATSRACLMEVAQMVESKKTILPIFFGVEPHVVRHQLDTYESSFIKHEVIAKYSESIKTWRAALRKISHLKGPVIKNEFRALPEINHFIRELLELLRWNDEEVPKSLVGIDEYMPEMLRKLGFDYQDGRGVVQERVQTGRWVFTVRGPPGVGKTTLAWVLYKKLSHFFEGCSFLENVASEFKQNNVVSLQNRLICELKRRGKYIMVKSSHQGTEMMEWQFRTSKVLIVLDDVDNRKQIQSLAELTWFGQGSRIILTTTRRDVYKVKRIEEQDILYEHEHEVLPMKPVHALELFRKCAFGLNHTLNNCDEMSKDIVHAVEYLPFAIDVVGEYLYGKSENKWRRTLAQLKVKLKDEVETMLEANYKLLGPEAKEVFLDIACFFTEVEKTIPCYMWDARGLDTGVDELQEKSFLKIRGKNEFWMHRQLKLLGREIVKKEGLDNPGERSRLWNYQDVQNILGQKKDYNRVNALHVASDFKRVDGELFYNLPNLRFLQLDEVDIEGNPVNLLPLLEWLDWRGCPKKSRGCPEKSKLFAFNMENLVILNLCSSPDKLTLEEWNQLMQKAGSLKVLKLTDCTWIKPSLEFPTSRHLECLILEGCVLFSPTIQSSISKFENLVSLNMRQCEFVKHLPEALWSMTKLKELLIDGTGIGELQFKKDSLPALEILSACDCKALHEVTDTIGFLQHLRKLYLRCCSRLKTLPNVFRELARLQEMDLSYTKIKELPPSVKHCKELRVLKMARTYLKGFPEAIKDLNELKELDFSHCGSLSGHCDIAGLSSLRILRLIGTEISEVLPKDKAQFGLHILQLGNDVAEQTQDQSNAG